MSQFTDFLQRVDALRAELDSLRPLEREREDRVMQKFRLWWTYHSNAIEGNTLTQGETEMFLMEGLTAKGKPLKDHLDLRGHSNAINYLLGFIRDREVLTEAAIRKLQEILLVEPYQVEAMTPDGLPTTKTVALGQYKAQPNHVRTPTGETHYYATPEETPAKMQDLMTWYRDESAKGTMHRVEIAARFHHRFTEIHPFDDGNGRMSRLLMNLMLMQAGYPPTVIRIGERDQYLAALRRADAGEYDDFLIFIAEHVVSALDLFIRAAKGEEITDLTDLEKEITLLKMGLKTLEEPEPLSQERQKCLFKVSFNPLFGEFVRLIAPLGELFSENFVNVGCTVGNDDIRRSFGTREKFLDTFAIPIPQDSWTGDYTIRQINYGFQLNGFKKRQFEAFDLSVTWAIVFDPLTYRLQISPSDPVLTIEHRYQEQLTKDEISEVAQKLARLVVDGIRQRTDGNS